MNMKSIGLKYHSEQFMSDILVYSALIYALGRLASGFIINRIGLKYTIAILSVLNSIVGIIFAMYCHQEIVFTICIYLFGIFLQIAVVCFMTTTTVVYGAELSVKLQTLFSLSGPLSIIALTLWQNFLYVPYGLKVTEMVFN